jgi:hypothetical protein
LRPSNSNPNNRSASVNSISIIQVDVVIVCPLADTVAAFSETLTPDMILTVVVCPIALADAIDKETLTVPGTVVSVCP